MPPLPQVRLKSDRQATTGKNWRNWSISFLVAIISIATANRNGYWSLFMLFPGAVPFLTFGGSIHSAMGEKLATAAFFFINLCVWTPLFYFVLFVVPASLKKPRKP